MKVKYSLLSKCRAEIMGLAIILIMFCHNTMVFPGFVNNVNSGLRALSDVGVNIFFFFSGYGCYYSMKKNGSMAAFYKKRALRVLTPFLIVLVAYGLFRVLVWHNPIDKYLWDYSLISFFADGTLNEWFVAAIIVLYLIFPLIFVLTEKKEKIVVAIVILIYLVMLAWIIGIYRIPPKNIRTVFGIFLDRIPNFLIGTLLAKKTVEDKGISKKWLPVLCVLGVVSCAVSLYVFKNTVRNFWPIMRTIYVFTAAMIIILVISIRVKCSDSKVLGGLSKFFTFLGGITLEIYLVHEKLLGIIDNTFGRTIEKSPYIMSVVVNIVAAVLSIAVAYCLKWLLEKTVLKRK